MQVLTDLKSRALRIARIHLTTARRTRILKILTILDILLQTKKRARARETKTPARKPCKRS